MGYWVTIVELSTYETQDNTFSLSFGQVCLRIYQDDHGKADFVQVFALFVAVPPLLQALPLVREIWYWFRGIFLVRRVAGPPPVRLKKGKKESYFKLPG